MRFTFNRYPIDVIICMIWSILLLPIALLEIEGTIRIILGLPFILFIPGYILIFALFPTKKTDRGIDIIERIALSFGLSIAVVPLIGLGLNYTPWGIRLEPILISIFIFIIGIGVIGCIQWFKTSPNKRFIIDLNISLPKSESKSENALNIILIITIIIAISLLIYVIITPKIGERFTEFYILGSEKIADEYPRNLQVGQNTSVIMGIVNHEQKTVNYTVEIWLINQSTIDNQTVYHHMWFMDKINITLDHVRINIEEPWKPQWEYNYTFNIKRTGNYKLAFLLFTKPTEPYQKNIDYKDKAEEKISSAYRNLHIWLTIT